MNALPTKKAYCTKNRSVILSIKSLSRVLLILSFLLPVLIPQNHPVSAQGSPTLSIYPASITVPLGNQALLNLEVSDGVDVNGFDILINYDAVRLLLVSWTYGDYLANLNCTRLIDQPGYFELTCSQGDDQEVDGDGILLTMTFDTLQIGLPDVSITEAIFTDSEGAVTYPLRRNGLVQVTNDPTFTPTGSSTPTYTQTLTPTPTTSISASETSTATSTPFLSPTAATATSGGEETAYPVEVTATMAETESAYPVEFMDTAVGTPIPSETPQPETTPSATPQPESSLTATPTITEAVEKPIDEDDDTGNHSKAQDLVKRLWTGVLWGLLILFGVILVGVVIILIYKNQKKGKEEDLLL